MASKKLHVGYESQSQRQKVQGMMLLSQFECGVSPMARVSKNWVPCWWHYFGGVVDALGGWSLRGISLRIYSL